MNIYKKRWIRSITRLAALTAILFGSQLITASAEENAVHIRLVLNESSFDSDFIELVAGQAATLTIVNKSEAAHTLMIGRDVMMKDGSPSAFEHNMLDQAEITVTGGDTMAGMDMRGGTKGMDTEHGFMVEVPAGDQEVALSFSVTEAMIGVWEIACFMDNGSRYEAGMQSTLAVYPEAVDRTVALALTELAFTPNNLELHVGETVALVLTNEGTLEHEFMAGREAAIHDGSGSFEQNLFNETNVINLNEVNSSATTTMDGMDMGGDHSGDTSGSDMNMNAGGKEAVEHGFMVKTPVGKQKYVLMITVTEDMLGDWEIGCFVANGAHYQAGMKGMLTVKEAASR